MTTIDELYCNIDDFNQFFYPEWEKTLLESGDKKRRRQGVMSDVIGTGAIMRLLYSLQRKAHRNCLC